jgi:hypothetical protein
MKDKETLLLGETRRLKSEIILLHDEIEDLKQENSVKKEYTSDVLKTSIYTQTRDYLSEEALKEGSNTRRHGPGRIELVSTENGNNIVPLGMRHLLVPVSASTIAIDKRTRRTFPRKALLQYLFKLCLAKVEADVECEEYGRPVRDMSDFVYSIYMLRHGDRNLAERDLLDLLFSLHRCHDNPRVHIFSNFLNNFYDSALEPGMESLERQQPLSPMEQLRCDVVNLRAGIGGGKSRTQRTMEFYTLFLNTVYKQCRPDIGGSQQIWLSLTTFLDLVALVFKKFPPFAIVQLRKDIVATSVGRAYRSDPAGVSRTSEVIDLDLGMLPILTAFLREDSRLHNSVMGALTKYDG